jgi:hypothetical protein
VLAQALAALRFLSAQIQMAECSSSTVTDGIQVDVTSAYVGVSELQGMEKGGVCLVSNQGISASPVYLSSDRIP